MVAVVDFLIVATYILVYVQLSKYFKSLVVPCWMMRTGFIQYHTDSYCTL